MKWLALFGLATAFAAAEPRGSIDVKGSLGWTGFGDDSLINHLQTGGSTRFYLTQRFSVEPEIQYLRGSRGHYDIVLVPNVNWDFRRNGPVVPYLTAGIGLIRTSDPFPGLPRFSSTDIFVQLGTGVKLYANDRWYVAPELRVGYALHIRASVAVGYTFRR